MESFFTKEIAYEKFFMFEKMQNDKIDENAK